jgi:penicillin-binding protein 1A
MADPDLPAARTAAAPAGGAPATTAARRGGLPAWRKPDRGAPRVRIGNRADGGVLYWLAKLYGFAALVALLATAWAVVGVYGYFSSSSPGTPEFRSYARVAPAVSRMYAADGTLLGEFASEYRRLVPFDQLPDRLVRAFLAVEDHEFFEHGGIYFKGIARALWANVTAGDFAQGGSTITQQVAKQFLGSEKSLTRKGKEAIMARRLEARYSKQAILSVYLNHIFLGAGAYGVAAAAQRYFHKELEELTLAECALIAGLAQAPSRYSPVRNPGLARERRDVVLDQMLKHGFATAEEVAAAKAEPIQLRVYHDVFPDRMPYYSEHVRRYVNEHPALRARFGAAPLMTAGLRVETAAEPTFEAAAYENVDYMAHKQDKRQGWRGPEWYLGDQSTRQLFVQRQRELYGDGPLDPARRYLALVEEVNGGEARLRVGDRQLKLPLANMDWAAPWVAGPEVPNDGTITSAKKALKPGDVVWVRREIRTAGKFREWRVGEKLNPTWVSPRDKQRWDDDHPDVVVLEQPPHPQVALFTGDHRTGYVPAMVGGTDFTRSVFNIAAQACRTPASAFKPIYYSLGLERGFGYDTVLYDEKITIVDPATGLEWTPQNIFEDLDGDVSLEYALVFSKNIPSIDLFKRLGKEAVHAWAKDLGFTSPFNVDDSMALGSSCQLLTDLARAFGIFARQGAWLEWRYVRRILDRDGNVVEDHTVPFDPMLAPGDRLDRVAATAGERPRQVMQPRTAFLTQKLLAKMVEHGLTKTVRNTELNAAGKTGTSDMVYDAQFLAFTSRLLTLVWAGDDKRVRTLGREDAAYVTVVPMWARYMWEVASEFPNDPVPWSVPPGVDPDDRGDHSKGERGAQMTLVRHYERDVMEAEGLLPPESEPGAEGAPAEGGAAPPAP